MAGLHVLLDFGSDRWQKRHTDSEEEKMVGSFKKHFCSSSCAGLLAQDCVAAKDKRGKSDVVEADLGERLRHACSPSLTIPPYQIDAGLLKCPTRNSILPRCIEKHRHATNRHFSLLLAPLFPCESGRVCVGHIIRGIALVFQE